MNLEMNTEGENGLLCTGLWCAWKMCLVWKHRNVWLLEKCLCLYFFIIWISCTPGALRYENIRVFIPKTSCQAARPWLIIQEFSTSIVISCLHLFWQVPFLHLILWQNKEQASFLPPKSIKTLMAMSHCLRWQHATIQKTKDRMCEK